MKTRRAVDHAKEFLDVLYPWRGYVLGAAIVLAVIALLVFGVMTGEQAKEWFHSVLDFIKK